MSDTFIVILATAWTIGWLTVTLTASVWLIFSLRTKQKEIVNKKRITPHRLIPLPSGSEWVNDGIVAITDHGNTSNQHPGEVARQLLGVNQRPRYPNSTLGTMTTTTTTTTPAPQMPIQKNVKPVTKKNIK
jgi:hypothetical protein